jgi:hypothetical protein
MQVLVRVFYLSAIGEPLADVEVQVILGASQIWNRRRDGTAMLAQSDGHFAQILEGRREAIDASCWTSRSREGTSSVGPWAWYAATTWPMRCGNSMKAR